MASLTGCAIDAQDLDIVRKFVLKLGGYAEGLFDYHDFGFSKNVLKRHLDQIEDDLRPRQEDTDGVRVKLTPPTYRQTPSGRMQPKRGITGRASASPRASP